MMKLVSDDSEKNLIFVAIQISGILIRNAVATVHSDMIGMRNILSEEYEVIM